MPTGSSRTLCIVADVILEFPIHSTLDGRRQDKELEAADGGLVLLVRSLRELPYLEAGAVLRDVFVSIRWCHLPDQGQRTLDCVSLEMI